jgi:hypothetical protein
MSKDIPFLLNNIVQTFLEYFYSEQMNPFISPEGNKKLLNKRKAETPHHRTDRRLTNRGVEVRNGKPEGNNIIANRYKQGDHNYQLNLASGVIPTQKAIEMATKANVKLPENGQSVRLRKGQYEISNNNGIYNLRKI